MSLIAAYNFDDLGATTVVDRSGNGRHISLSGQPGAQVTSSGALDSGALGKTGAGLIPLPAALRTAFEVDDRSLMLDALGLRSVWWVRSSSNAFGTGVFGLLSLDAATIISRARTQTNVGPSNTIALGALSASVRHNFCLTYKRSTGVLTGYYDGVSAGTATFTPGTALYVGSDDFDMAEWSATGAAIDNLRFFDHALTGAEVAALAGTPVSAAAEEHSGAVTLSASTAVDRSGAKSTSRGVTLPAAGSVSAVAGKVANRSATLAAASSAAVAGSRTSTGTTALATAAGVVLSGGHAGGRSPVLSSTAGVTAVGSSVRFGTVTLAASVSVTAGPPAEEHDITLTATLAEQPAPAVSVGARRWTATLGEKP